MLRSLILALGLTVACSDTAPSPRTRPGGTPLVVTATSHVVVMEYEAWFGPNAVTFQGTAAAPMLQSTDMRAVGGGYDSADPKVIAQHVSWLERIGVDAALIEVTNDVSCIFDSEWFVQRYLQNFNSCPALRPDYQAIRDNTGNLYGAWSALGTKLALIPMVGAIDQNVFVADSDGKTAFEKEIEYFGALMTKYPSRNVVYQGKPLMLIYLGAAQDPNRADNPLWAQALDFLSAHPTLGAMYTFRLVAGYLDSQSDLWASAGTTTGPTQINPVYGFWSWVDRLAYPSYNNVSGRVENFTAAIATAGQNGWGCPNPNAMPYCVDDALRFGPDSTYGTFATFMGYARTLQPIFLILHQFNEFTPPDEGFDANTDDDIEPANLWGMSALEAAQQQVAQYRSVQ